MFIRAYLRASTKDQNADRAKDMLKQFVEERGHRMGLSQIDNKAVIVGMVRRFSKLLGYLNRIDF